MEAKVKKQIKDIEEFCKLYKINIPVESEFQYYVDTLKKSPEFGYLTSLVQTNIDYFKDLEEFVENNHYKDVREYKNVCLDVLKDHLMSTQAYKSMMESELPMKKMFSRDHINMVDEFDYLVSLDFVSANYSILKTFEKGETELDKSWSDLCSNFGVHEALVRSKSFRQVVFGNTSPKRLQTFQHEKILTLVEYLKGEGEIKDERMVFISHDEIVINFKSADAFIKFTEANMSKMESISGMRIKVTPYSLKKLKKNTFVKTLYRVNPKTNYITSFSNSGIYEFEKKYNTLHGVPGHKFYMYFKKYILNEALEERDLMYYNDGELCLWVDEDARANKKGLPHYEKPGHELSIKEVREEYSYLWEELGKRVPTMVEEEKRRVVELFVNTCKECLQGENPCTCWRDE
jgi:hypothetical protein